MLEKSKKIIKEIFTRLKPYFIELIYVFITLKYLNKLKLLNNELLQLDGWIEILQHSNSIALKYFICAIVLSILAGTIIIYRVKIHSYYINDVLDSIIFVMAIVLMIFFFGLIIKNITIPIFQAILSALGCGIIILGSKS